MFFLLLSGSFSHAISIQKYLINSRKIGYVIKYVISGGNIPRSAL